MGSTCLSVLRSVVVELIGLLVLVAVGHQSSACVPFLKHGVAESKEELTDHIDQHSGH